MCSCWSKKRCFLWACVAAVWSQANTHTREGDIKGTIRRHNSAATGHLLTHCFSPLLQSFAFYFEQICHCIPQRIQAIVFFDAIHCVSALTFQLCGSSDWMYEEQTTGQILSGEAGTNPALLAPWLLPSQACPAHSQISSASTGNTDFHNRLLTLSDSAALESVLTFFFF